MSVLALDEDKGLYKILAVREELLDTTQLSFPYHLLDFQESTLLTIQQDNLADEAFTIENIDRFSRGCSKSLCHHLLLAGRTLPNCLGSRVLKRLD